MMGSFGLFTGIRSLGLLATVLLIVGCSSSGEDVRVTLCRDIVYTQIGASATVLGTGTETKGRERAVVKVRYSFEGREAQAVCSYDYDAVDDTALHLSDPLSAYATSPYEVVIDGRKLSQSILAEAVKQAMLKQGRELLDHAKKGIESALQR